MRPSLSRQMRDVHRTLRCHLELSRSPPVEVCRLLADKLSALIEQADALEVRARTADEMEVVARDLDLIAHARAGQIGVPDYQETVRREQAAIQAQLDAEDAAGADQVARPGSGRVIAFTPRRRALVPQFDGDGDAA